MDRYMIGGVVDIEATFELPRRGGREEVRPMRLAINPAKDLFGLVLPREDRISHMSYGLDYVNPVEAIARHGRRDWWYFDAGTTRNGIKVAITDLLRAFVELGILTPPFSITWDGGELHDVDLITLVEKVEDHPAITDKTRVTVSDSDGHEADGVITR